MDTSDQERSTCSAEASTLLSLMRQGLCEIQRGCYGEGSALLALARQQLPPDRMQLASVIDTFLHEYAEYQYVQHALQEASRRFANAQTEQQARAANLAKVLPTLIDHIYSTNLKPQTEKSGYSSSLPELSITCFGRFEVRKAGKPITLCSSRNGRGILRYLIAKPGRSATSDVLQELFWPENEPETAQRKLHIAISQLRRSLNVGCQCEVGGGYIVCRNQVYSLNAEAVIRTDFEELLHHYRIGQQSKEERIERYKQACRFYTGPFLCEDLYADWSFIRREQLAHTYLTMCSVLVEHYLEVKQYEYAAQWATAILKENRCNEAAHRYLIRIYLVQGHRQEALRQYQQCEHLLIEELGVPPLPETRMIVQALFPE